MQLAGLYIAGESAQLGKPKILGPRAEREKPEFDYGFSIFNHVGENYCVGSVMAVSFRRGILKIINCIIADVVIAMMYLKVRAISLYKESG